MMMVVVMVMIVVMMMIVVMVMIIVVIAVGLLNEMLIKVKIAAPSARNIKDCSVVVIIITIIVVLTFIIAIISIFFITITIIMIYCSTICQATPNEDCLVVVIGQGRDFLPLAPLRALSTGQCQ